MKEQPEKPHVVVALVVVFLLFLWELAYGLGLIDPLRFSHPLGVLPVLMDINFLRGFGIMLLQVLFASLLGGGIGVFVGSVILRSTWLSQATLRFLRLGQWLSFFVFWALPIWGFKKGELTDAPFWIVVTVMGIIAAFPTVTLSAIYYFLSARSTLGLNGREARPQVVRGTILQALLICLLWQVWLQPYGWRWFIPQVADIASGYAAMVLLAVFILLVDRTCQLDFNRAATLHEQNVFRELSEKRRHSLFGALLLAVLCVMLWQVFNRPMKTYFVIDPPLEVLTAGYRLLLVGLPRTDTPIWEYIYVSFKEISAGLLVSGGVALCVVKLMGANPEVPSSLRNFIPLTFVAPIPLGVIVIYWIGIGFWHKAAQVACLSFYPFVQALWAFRERPVTCGILLGVDSSLPYAIVGMLFAEAWAAVAGLGFFIIVAWATFRIDEAVATALITFALLLALSSTLRWVARRLYFSGSSPQVLAAQT